MIRKCLSLYLAAVMGLSGLLPVGTVFAQDGKSYTIAVLNLDPKGVSQVEAEVLSDKLRSHIMQLVSSPEYVRMTDKDQYTVVEQAQIEKIFEQFDLQSTGCVSDSCAIEFGKMLQADRIVLGTLGLVGSTYSVAARVIDVETSTTISTADQQFRGAIDDVINSVIPQVGDDLILGRQKKSRLKWYLLAGLLAAAGGGAAMMGGGGGSDDSGGGSSAVTLPLPPDRP